MKIEIEIPEGSRAEWIGGKLTLVPDIKVGDSVVCDSEVSFYHDGLFVMVKPGTPMRVTSCDNGICVLEREGGGAATVCITHLSPYAPEPAKDITERIKTFEDAYQWCVENGEANLVNHYDDWEIYNDTSKDIIAYLKLRIITAALNEGWEPKLYNQEWYVYSEPSEFLSVVGTDYLPGHMMRKLAFRTEDLAQYAMEEFGALYTDFCGCEKGGEK